MDAMGRCSAILHHGAYAIRDERGRIVARTGFREDAELIASSLNGRGAVGTPEERIADVLHSIGFGAERHEIARQMLRFAQDFGGR